MKAAMRLSVLLAGTALAKTTCTKKTSSAPVPTKQHGCNADNCARAVTGTYQGPASQSAHRAACSSFLECTAYPATVTITATTTTFPTTATATVYPVTETDVVTLTTVIINAPTVIQVSSVFETVIDQVTVTLAKEPEIVETVTIIQKRAAALVTGSAPLLSSVVCPTAVPTYASACSGTVRYSSACSCFGVTKTTTTMTTPTTTITTTIIGQTTVTASDTSIVTELVSATSSVPTTIVVETTVIDSITSLVTVQSTTTTSSSPTPTVPGCTNGNYLGNDEAYCYTVYCQYMKIEDTPYSTPSAATLQDCINECDADINCNTFNYDAIDQTCQLYASTSFTLQSTPGWAAGYVNGNLGGGQSSATCNSN